MNKILSVFKYAGFSLVFIAIISVANHIISAVSNFNNGLLSISLIENDVRQEVKIVNDAKFINSHLGVYEFKPTLMEAIILSERGIDNIGPNVVFYLILGAAIIVVAYIKPKSVENLTENRLWQLVAAGGILFLSLKFLTKFLIDEYIGNLTHNAFKYYYPADGSFNLNILSLIAILSVIYELLSYSRKLKAENDLTI